TLSPLSVPTPPTSLNDQPGGSFAQSATTSYRKLPLPTIIAASVMRAGIQHRNPSGKGKPRRRGNIVRVVPASGNRPGGETEMPYGGNDWLALTQEETLEPELPICDPHHHFWDFRFERIPYQRYLLHELAADVSCGHNVRSTVFIEARSMYRPDGPAELRPVGEVEFVQGLAAAAVTGLYGPCRAASAIVGHADLKLGDRVEPVLEALQAASPNRFRGIRHTVTWDPHPEIENREKEGVLASADYRAGAQVLARKGLSLDIGVCFPQLPELAAFARAVPDVTIILNHLGGLMRVGPYANKDDEVLPNWQRGIAAVAECSNVNLKL